jgi:hypothetical protein
MRDLTNSKVDRKIVLNNNNAISEVYNQLGFPGVMFEGKYRFTKSQVAAFYEIDIRTIERILDANEKEFVESGYELFTGSRLRALRSTFEEAANIGRHVSDIHVGDISQSFENELISNRAPSIGIFTFKTLLNVGMLLTSSERAREVRSAILNIVIDVLNKRLGGTTKYINQREEEFLPSAIREFNYRQEFTNALDKYLEPNKFKYAQLTDKIYLSIFKEDAKEYRQVLSLNAKESVRATMYSEVLDLVSSYENGFADFLRRKSETHPEKFRLNEAHILFKEFEETTESIYAPLKEKARGLMASRDMAFRDALHIKLKEYVSTVSLDDIDRFLGEKSKQLEQRIVENKEVFKRLKDR